MKVFLNGTNAQKPNFRNAAEQLIEQGDIVTSSWIYEPSVSVLAPVVTPSPQQATYLAEVQLDQIDHSDVMVTVLNGFGNPDDRDFRMGYCFGSGTKHVLVGDPEGNSLFQRCDGLTVFPSLLAALKGLSDHRQAIEQDFPYASESWGEEEDGRVDLTPEDEAATMGGIFGNSQPPHGSQSVNPQWFGFDPGKDWDQTGVVKLIPRGDGGFRVEAITQDEFLKQFGQAARDQREADDRSYRMAGIAAGNPEGYEAAAEDYSRAMSGKSVNPEWTEHGVFRVHGTLNAAQEAQAAADQYAKFRGRRPGDQQAKSEQAVRTVGLPDQPSPTPNGYPSAHDLVIQDFQERKATGLARYHSLLQPHNGRNQLVDALQELADLHVYLRALLYEQTGV